MFIYKFGMLSDHCKHQHKHLDMNKTLWLIIKETQEQHEETCIYLR